MPFWIRDLRQLGEAFAGAAAARLRTGVLLLAAAATVATACGGGGGAESGRCATVTCAVAGTTCSPDDGLCHCGGSGGPVCPSSQVCQSADGTCAEPVTLPDPICTAGTRWEPGVTAFRDATSDWGLDALGVEGVRLTVTDIDGDGWPDLLVHRGGNTPDDFGPDGARQTWLLRNTGTGRFEDVTVASGLITTRGAYEPEIGRPGEVVAWGDVDNDGDLDAYTGLTTSDPSVTRAETSEVMINDGTGRFSFTVADNPVRRADTVDVPAGASFVDYDRDGLLDLWVAQFDVVAADGSETPQQDRLFRGDGTGRFTDVTEAAGLTTSEWDDLDALNDGLAHSRGWSAAACDLNGDGWPDLLAASYGRAPNHLWLASPQSDGTVRFVNRSVPSGYAYDDDLTWQDNQFARCFCQAHRDAEDCADVPAPSITCDTPNWDHDTDRQPFRLGGNSASTTCADFDNDGDLDLFTGEIRHWWAGSGSDGSEVLVNDGAADVHFERPGDPATGLDIPHAPGSSWDEGHMTQAAFDFDNDGWLDLYIGASDYAGNHGLLYHQDAPLAFTEVPISQGIDHHRSHGVVVADFDRDGDLDVVVGHSLARCDPSAPDDCYPTAQVRFFENVLGQDGNWIQLDLEGGPGSNRAAIGARVSVTAGSVTQTQEVEGGHGHYGSQHSLILHFGLGAACEADVTVRWPDAVGTRQTFHVVSGYRYHVRQGEAPVVL